MEQSKSEKIARIILVVSGLTMLSTMGIHGIAGHTMPQQVLAVVIDLSWASQAVTLVSFAFFITAARKRILVQRKVIAQINIEAVNLPNFSTVDSSKAIMSLFWSLDYKSRLLLNTKYALSLPTVWIWAAVLGTLLISPWMPTIGWDRPWLLVSSCLVATAVLIAYYLFLMARSLKRNYMNGVQTINIGLVIDKNHMHYIAGRTVNEYSWSALKSVNQRAGVIRVVHSDFQDLVPYFAFRTLEDSKAFVALALALKNGEDAPTYDWSAYKPEIPTAEGVWPPPVA